MGSISILLANDHPIIRSSIRLLLERQPGFCVVAEAANGREALVLAEYKRPDIVVLDVQLPVMTGIAASREIFSKAVGTGIIFLTSHKEEDYVSEAFKAGARAYVSASAAQTDLIRAVHVVLAGGFFISPSISNLLFESSYQQFLGNRVSDQEKRLYSLIAAAWDDQEIASELGIDLHSIELAVESLGEALSFRRVPEVIASSCRYNRHLAKSA